MRAMLKTSIKTRFAPSPTGLLHLGNLRTALFSALYARRQRGRFLLRIEDTDASRSRSEYEARLEADMRWLGLDWDEGPGMGGDAGPYRQSQRDAIYGGLFDRLLAEGAAYRCFCSQETLAASRKAQLATGRPPRYPGTCAGLDPAEATARAVAGESCSLRFRVTPGIRLPIGDLVMGEQVFASDDIGDFVIRRSDGSPAFFFSNAVDDALMGVTHVLRGADHISNSPRQVLLLRALALPEPHYAHLSLIVGADGAPLSKRHGAGSVEDLRVQGYLPLALLNHLARLGHSYPDEQLLDLAGLAEGFELTRLGRSPARHDTVQLDHWQRLAVALLDERALKTWAEDACTTVPESLRRDFLLAVRDNSLFPADVATWADNLFGNEPRPSPDACEAMNGAPRNLFEISAAMVDEHPDDFRAFSSAVGQAAGLRGKALFMPLRAALTGQTHGPEMARLYPLLGPARARERLLVAAKSARD
ncbi:glutamate--tRNA ligase [Acidihalobacter yilgarnensis]|uniref:Glutamate--tRNA ligase n=2 Tax=Acidihalobacter yilgarnensis TaxID=2819280 RepID=A0A1D8IT65_9GAMM|nr:glutamate--tRNA ligase [Acidihalobacter yilgarnensis]